MGNELVPRRFSPAQVQRILRRAGLRRCRNLRARFFGIWVLLRAECRFGLIPTLYRCRNRLAGRRARKTTLRAVDRWAVHRAKLSPSVDRFVRSERILGREPINLLGEGLRESAMHR